MTLVQHVNKYSHLIYRVFFGLHSEVLWHLCAGIFMILYLDINHCLLFKLHYLVGMK
jgi:hypothetical protein